MREKQDLTVADALERVLSAVSIIGDEFVGLLDAPGRVLADDVIARDSLPPFNNSSMDGFALRSADIATASRAAPASLRVIGDVAAGHWPDIILKPGMAARIMTGAPIPAGADAVVPVEDSDEGWAANQRPLPDFVQIFRSVDAGDYIRPEGDDFAAGDVILTKGHIIRPQEVSVLASLGVAQVPVYRRALVGILATGDELVPVEDALTPGKIRNSNGYAQSAQVSALGAIPLRLGVARDTERDVREKLQAGIDAGVDLFISSAGVSVGAFDVVKDVLDQGGDVNFWRVRMRPGKPLAFGRYAGIPYIGLPGNPVSSMVSFETFARPAILKMMGHSKLAHQLFDVELTEAIDSDGRESYIRAIVTQDGNRYFARTTGGQGSHMITSLVRANALLIIPEGIEQVAVGTLLKAYFL